MKHLGALLVALAACGPVKKPCDTCVDASVNAPDAAVDAGVDAGLDAGRPDAGRDAGAPDAGPPDAGEEPLWSDAGCRFVSAPAFTVFAGYGFSGGYEWSYVEGQQDELPTDLLTAQIVWSAGGHPDSGIVDLSLEPNYFSCRYCVRYSEDCDRDESNCLRDYFAREGTLEVGAVARGSLVGTTVMQPPSGSLVQARFSHVRLVEWSLANDVPVPDGRCVEVRDANLSGPIP